MEEYEDRAYAAYILIYRGAAVFSKTYSLKELNGRLRATSILERDSGKWRIVHEHLSRGLHASRVRWWLRQMPPLHQVSITLTPHRHHYSTIQAAIRALAGNLENS